MLIVYYAHLVAIVMEIPAVRDHEVTQYYGRRKKTDQFLLRADHVLIGAENLRMN